MYEITFIAKTETASLQVKNILKEEKAEILFEFPMGRKQFSYPIKKEHAGFYTCIYFEVENQVLDKLTKKLYSEKEILRFLLVKSVQNISELKNYLEKDKKQNIKPRNFKQEIKEPIAKQEVKENEIKEEKPAQDEIKPVKTKKPLPKVKKSKTLKADKKIEEPKEKTAEKTAKTSETVAKDNNEEQDRIKKLEEKLDELLKE